MVTTVDFNVSGAGTGFEDRATAVDRSGEVMVGVVALLRRVREVDADGAGAGGGLKLEVCVWREVEVDGAGAAAKAGGAG